jgi:hypothetical protein
VTLHVYNCETAVVRSEMVKRNKAGEVFYGLRLHMNTDQAITFWSKTEGGLMEMVSSLLTTLFNRKISESETVPGQMS